MLSLIAKNDIEVAEMSFEGIDGIEKGRCCGANATARSNSSRSVEDKQCSSWARRVLRGESVQLGSDDNARRVKGDRFGAITAQWQLRHRVESKRSWRNMCGSDISGGGDEYSVAGQNQNRN
ncbi:hypothetical protein Q1695_000804 [Nippostrongylus brasiliensis]|nr:hypothetical protein Q1695_000804 [Nippostrongylus brasiliensis]